MYCTLINCILLVAVGVVLHEYLKLRQQLDSIMGQPDRQTTSQTQRAKIDVPLAMSNEDFTNPTTNADLIGKIEREGSSVWCSGDVHTKRLCLFKNLCHVPGNGTYVFFHSKLSNIQGVPRSRYSPALLDLSSVQDHNTQYFNYYDVPAGKASVILKSAKFVRGTSLLFNRFKPDNLMHVLHDDLLPMFYTLKMMAGHTPDLYDEITRTFKVQLAFMDLWEEQPFLELYRLFSDRKPLIPRYDLEFGHQTGQVPGRESFVCFENAYVGLLKETVWYQYGFFEPQGPLPNEELNSFRIRHFTKYVREKLSHSEDHRGAKISPSDAECENVGKDYIVLFTRKENRLILNELDLTLALVKAFHLPVFTLSIETHSLGDILALLNRTFILIGMHGSLLSLSMFLPYGAILVELFPFAVNPARYTPYQTLTNVPGMGILYKAWRNLDEEKTVTHPDWHEFTGGIDHLSRTKQEEILNSKEVPPHLCCHDPEWLFRIYQDTFVDIDAVVLMIRDAIKQRDAGHSRIASDRLLLAQRQLPAGVSHLTCSSNPQTMGPSLYLKWAPPWNVQHLETESVKYEIWLQTEGLNDTRAWITEKSEHQFTEDGDDDDDDDDDDDVGGGGIECGLVYYAWVRCIVGDTVAGPFNWEHATCQC